MITENLSTQFTTTLASNGGSITAAATTFNVAATLPSAFKPPFRALIAPTGSMTGEIVLVTAVSSLAWTVTRGQETTLGAPVASIHNDGESVSPVLTGAGIHQIGTSCYVDASAYGADPSGVADSTAGINAALTAAGNIGTVFLRSGVYRISGTIALGYGQSLVGAGHYQTWLYTTATTGDCITLNTGSTLKGIFFYGANTTATAGATLSATPQTIATGTLATGWPTSGTGTISLTNGTWTTITWTGVTAASLTGCTGVGAFSAAAVINVRSANYGVNDNSLSNILIDDVWIQNMYDGLALSGVNNLFTNSWVYNVVRYSCVVLGANSAPFLDSVTLAWSTGNKPTAQLEVQACGNLTVLNCQLIQGTYGMDIAPTGAGVFSVYCCNTFFDSCVTAGLNIQSGANVVRSKFDQCWFCTSVNGVVMNNISIAGVDFDNCEISNNSANGMLISAAADWSVHHSRIAGNTTAGISVAASPTTMKLDISNNLIGSVTPGFGANGTGIILAAGTYGSQRILNNNLMGNTTALTDSTTVTTTANNNRLIMGNLGYNPKSVVAQPAVPTSTTVVWNSTGVDCTVFVKGGTLTAITIGGVVSGIAAALSSTQAYPIRVVANQQIAITYSVAPTWVWIGS